MKTLYYCLIIISILLKSYLSYEIPLVRLDVLTNGFTISLPDDPEIRKVFYVININEQCPGIMDLILESKNHLWSTTQATMTIQARDKLKISLLVNHNGEAYKSLQHIVVGENNNKATLSHIPADQPAVKCGGNKSESLLKRCDAAQTIVKGLTNICQNQLIFEENFDSSTLDMTKWSYDIRALSTGKATEEFVVFDSNEENIHLTGGYLNIKPTLTTATMREASIDFGSRCTPVSAVRSECKISSLPPIIYVPPVNSSQIHTRSFFNFKYGRVEIKAKLPKGDWLLPYIMLQNYGPFERKQIRIAFARGNERLLTTTDSQDLGGRRLYGGIVKDDESRLAILKDTYNFEHYGNTFHIYTLTWTNDAITIAVDGETFGEIRENLNDYNDEFFLALGVSAGGYLEFPDNLQNSTEKPWKNKSPRAIHSFWQSFRDGKISWNDSETTMQIDYVKIYAI